MEHKSLYAPNQDNAIVLLGGKLLENASQEPNSHSAVPIRSNQTLSFSIFSILLVLLTLDGGNGCVM